MTDEQIGNAEWLKHRMDWGVPSFQPAEHERGEMNTNNAIAVPAGWYPDPDNTSGFRYGSAPSLRYFDGMEWTDQRAPMNRRQPQAAPPIVNQVYANASPTVIVRGGTNHALHLVLTVLTCGMWLPVWIIVAIFGGR